MKKTKARNEGECENCRTSWKEGEYYYAEPYHALCVKCHGLKLKGCLKYNRKEKRYKASDTLERCDYYDECKNNARFTDRETGKVLCEYCIGKVITSEEI